MKNSRFGGYPRRRVVKWGINVLALSEAIKGGNESKIEYAVGQFRKQCGQMLSGLMLVGPNKFFLSVLMKYGKHLGYLNKAGVRVDDRYRSAEKIIREYSNQLVSPKAEPAHQGTKELDPRFVSVIDSHPAIPYLFVLGKPESVEIYKTAWGVVAFEQEETYKIIGNEIGKELSNTIKEKLSESLGSIIRRHAKTIENADSFVDQFRPYYQKCNQVWQEQGQEPPEEERAFLIRMIAEYLIKSIANNLQGKRGTKIKPHVYENNLRFIGYD